MKKTLALVSIFASVAALTACERETVVATPAPSPTVASTEPSTTVVQPVPVPVPGPPGPQGEPGKPGDQGAPGRPGDTQVIITPPAAASEPK